MHMQQVPGTCAGARSCADRSIDIPPGSPATGTEGQAGSDHAPLQYFYVPSVIRGGHFRFLGDDSDKA